MKTATVTAPRTKKSKAQPIVKTDRQWAEEIFPQTVETLAGIDDKYKAWKGQQLKAAKSGLARNDKNGLTKILADLQAFSKEDAERNAKEAAKQAAEAEAKAALAAVWAPVTDAWNSTKLVARAWVEVESAKGHKGQMAFDAKFRSDYQKMAERVSQVSIEDTEAVQALVKDLAELAAEVNRYVQNWCRTCGEPIEASITPKKGGKPFEPKFCRKDVPVKKAKNASTQRAGNDGITLAAIQELEMNSDLKGITVHTKRHGTIRGGSAPYELDETDVESMRKVVRATMSADEAEDEAEIASTERIGKKHRVAKPGSSAKKVDNKKKLGGVFAKPVKTDGQAKKEKKAPKAAKAPKGV